MFEFLGWEAIIIYIWTKHNNNKDVILITNISPNVNNAGLNIFKYLINKIHIE